MARVLLISHDYRNPQKVSFRRVGAVVRFLSEHGDQITVASAISGTVKQGDWGESILGLKTASEGRASGKPALNKAGVRLGMIDRSTLFWIAALLRSAPLRDAARSSDFVMATYGPAGPLWAAFALSVLSRRPLVLDFRDVPESRTRQTWLALTLDRLLESVVVRRASMVVTVGGVLAEYLQARHHGVRCEVMYNGWNEDDLEYGEPEPTEDYIYYAGTVYDHRIAAFEAICGAITSTETRLKVRLLGNNADVLREIAQRCGVGDRVEILGSADRDTVKREQRRARAVLVLESLDPSSSWQAGTVTGKLMGLIASRRPGFAVCREGSEMSLIVRRFPWWGTASDSQTLSALLNAPGAQPNFDDAQLESFKMQTQVNKLRLALMERLPGARRTRR